MSLLGSFIAERTPKFNKEITEGYCYHRMKDGLEYLDGYLKYSSQEAFNRILPTGETIETKTRLEYLSYRQLTPEETVKAVYRKKSNYPYDISKSTLYLTDFVFQYGGEPEPRVYQMWLPFFDKGNRLTISDREFVLMPLLGDLVVSVGTEGVFIGVQTAKYNFAREIFDIVEDDHIRKVSIVHTKLYRNAPTNYARTTKALPTVMHFLLASHGFTNTMKLLLGFVPGIAYTDDLDNEEVSDDVVVYRSLNAKPSGYILRPGEVYQHNNIAFTVPRELNNHHVTYVLGNVLYILANFTRRVSIGEMDETLIWRRFMGEIVYTGHALLSTIESGMKQHFEGLLRRFDIKTIHKLQEFGLECRCLLDLLGEISKNYLNWITTRGASRRFVGNKVLEAENIALEAVTRAITLLFLDINKEEIRAGDVDLDSKTVDKIFKDRFRQSSIYAIRKNKVHVTDVEDSTDHLYPKMTSRVVFQESDFTNKDGGTSNTSLRKKLVADMAVIGSFLNLPKQNPTPDARANMYMRVDPVTGAVRTHPDLEHILVDTDEKLSKTHQAHNITVMESEDVEIDDGDYFSIDDEMLED